MVMVTDDPYRHRILPGDGYEGVVRITNGDTYGTGVLLGGRAVLTAAHVVEKAESLSVRIDAEHHPVSLKAEWYRMHPTYDPANGNGDLALLWLSDSAPVGVERAGLYRAADELGQTTTLVGYGRTGEGARGYDLDDDVSADKHLAENRFDVTGDMLKDALGLALGWTPKPRSQLIVDFDDGTEEHDNLGSLAGYHDTGLGDREGIIAPGDSGGPAFIDGKVAGIATYSASPGYGAHSPDVTDSLDGSYGEIAGFQRVSYYQDWIDRSLRAAHDEAPTSPDEVALRVEEGDDGTQFVYFLVEFHGQREFSDKWLSVDYATRDGTARAGEDYLPVADTLILYPGETQAAIPVEVIGDDDPEGNETFYLDVTNPAGGELAGGAATLTAVRTIVDDDLGIA